MTSEHRAPTETPDDLAVDPTGHPATALRAVLVRYDHRPDRCTICPRSMSREELTTAWITADATAFYDLAETQ